MVHASTILTSNTSNCFKFKRRRKRNCISPCDIPQTCLCLVFILYSIIEYSNHHIVRAFIPIFTTNPIATVTKFRSIHNHPHIRDNIRNLHYASKKSKSTSSSSSSSSSSPPSSPKEELFQKRSKSWVVMVDDEESIRLSVGNYLFQAGYSVTACADAEALLEMLSSISQGVDQGLIKGTTSNMDDDDGGDGGGTFYEDRFPNAIICDIRMPGQGMDGLDLLTILKNPPLSSSSETTATTSITSSSAIVPSSLNQNYNNNDRMKNSDWNYIRQQWKRIPVVLLTAKSLTQDRIEGYRRGADVYLSKPFSPEELLSILDNLIERTKILSSNGSSDNGDGERNRSVSLNDLKGDLLEIKGLLRDKKKTQKTRRLLRGANDGEGTSITNNNNKLGNGKSSPSSSALVPLSKYKRLGKNLANGRNILESDIDDFNDNVELTPTEKDILNLVSQGYTNGEIAKRRGNSSTTSVSRTISGLYSKTLTKTRTELVKWGMKMGYISTD